MGVGITKYSKCKKQDFWEGTYLLLGRRVLVKKKQIKKSQASGFLPVKCVKEVIF